MCPWILQSWPDMFCLPCPYTSHMHPFRLPQYSSPYLSPYISQRSPLHSSPRLWCSGTTPTILLKSHHNPHRPPSFSLHRSITTFVASLNTHFHHTMLMCHVSALHFHPRLLSVHATPHTPVTLRVSTPLSRPLSPASPHDSKPPLHVSPIFQCSHSPHACFSAHTDPTYLHAS